MRNALPVLLVGSLLAGCGGGSPSAPSTPAPTIAIVTASVTPSPIIATPSTNPAYRWAARWTLTVAESGGVPGNVNYVNATLRDATTGIELNTIAWTAYDVIGNSDTGTNHVNAMGSLRMPMGLFYTLAFGGRQATLTVAVNFTDDRGNQHNKVVTVSVV